jgi:phosphoglucosamine mutase
MKIYPQVLRNVIVSDKEAAQNNPKVQEAVRKAGEDLGSNGRILVRPSGTEPLIRVMVEAETDEICGKTAGAIVEVMKSEGLVKA